MAAIQGVQHGLYLISSTSRLTREILVTPFGNRTRFLWRQCVIHY